jgi:hypothetical protein
MNRSIWVVAGIALLSTLASAGGITYTCDPTVSLIDGSGVCAYLDTTIANYYNSTFTNANASIYITTIATGLGESDQQIDSVPYSTYFSALAAESTDTTALNSLSATEPAIFGGGAVGLTAALANALGIPGPLSGLYENPTDPGDPLNGTVCTLTTINCFNGVISVVTPAGLSSETGGQGLWFRDVTGTAGGPQPGNDYDYFSVVEHETDEILGTSSCSGITSGPTATNFCDGPSAVDLFRYSGPGALVYNSLTCAYFSPDSGTTDADGNNYNSTCPPNQTAATGEDYADFSTSCTFIQDATGCLGHSYDITNDYMDGPGPEIQILNATGYDLVTPEPATAPLFAAGLLFLLAFRHRHRP